ncbi:MAG: TonB family protein, partial [Terriglobales bacterium]
AKEEVLDKPKDLTNAVLVGRQEPSFTASVTELPSFAAFAEPDDDQSGSGKKILIVAIAILALALVAYFAWSEFSGYHSSAVSHPAITTAQQEQQNGPNSELGAASTAAAAPLPANKVARANPSKPAVASNTSQSQSGRPSPSAATERIELSIEPGAKQSGVAPMLVKPGIPAPADNGETTVQQPPSLAAADSPDNSKLSGLITSEQNVAKPTLAQIKVSQGVSQGLLIKRVQPKYPARALASHVQGAVEIEATIDKEGNVVSPKVLSGDAMLAGAAVEAVRQWRYKPYYLNGEPVEIQTQITIHFKGN